MKNYKSNVINHSDRKHAILSASASERWLNCTPSAILESNYPETISPFAEEGTKAHEICELYINTRLGIIDELALKKATENTPKEMQQFAKAYADYVFAIKNTYVIKIENKLDLKSFIPEGFGTCDAFVITNDNNLHIIDFKYGKGVKVSAINNTQLMIYALGVIDNYQFKEKPKFITLHIFQPRIQNISTFTITYQTLKQWSLQVLIPKSQIAFKGLGKEKYGEWCRFCKHKYNCKIQKENYKKLKEQAYGKY